MWCDRGKKKNENHEEKTTYENQQKKLHNFPEKTKTVLGRKKNLLLYRKQKILHFFSSLMKNSPTGKRKALLLDEKKKSWKFEQKLICPEKKILSPFFSFFIFSPLFKIFDFLYSWLCLFPPLSVFSIFEIRQKIIEEENNSFLFSLLFYLLREVFSSLEFFHHFLDRGLKITSRFFPT